MNQFKIAQLLLCLLCTSVFFSQDDYSFKKLKQLPISKTVNAQGDVFLQGNFTEILTGKVSMKGLQEETIEFLQETNSPQPSVATIRKHL